VHLPHKTPHHTARHIGHALGFPVLLVALVSLSALSAGKDISNVPSWAKEAVWYQIFPERFRNGDPSNDPTPGDIAGGWPHEVTEGWQVSPWTSDWYQLQPWEEKGGKGFYYHVQQRRYGGDLQGVIDKLDYLQDLGINAVYFNPLFEAPSLHKYDATMYHHIDNNFGPDPEGDRRVWASENPADPSTWQWTSADSLFLKLLEQAHARGIRVIIDGVFNHVGITFWAFRDVVEQGLKSPYNDWFVIKQWDDPATAENEFDYAGWYGVRELPEIRENEQGLVEGPRNHVRAVVKRWMDPDRDGDPSDGIDGWRLDVAEMVGIPFWREFRSWVREINPEAYIVGEVWWEDWRNGKMFNAAPWLGGDAFDAVMNYRWAREVGHFFKDNTKKITATEFNSRLEQLRADYRSDVNYVLMNLMDSHDTDRLSSQIVNVDSDYDRGVNVRDNPSYDVRKPHEDEIRTQKLIVMFQMTCLGSPMVYYGGETGMWGADDPDERKPMLWSDMHYDDEVHHSMGKSRPADTNLYNADLHDFYRDMIHLRREHRVLSLGTFTSVLTDDARDLFAYARSMEGEVIIVIVNNSGAVQECVLPEAAGKNVRQWEVLYSMPGGEVHDDGRTVVLPGKSGIILKPKR
jgi:glycosidase